MVRLSAISIGRLYPTRDTDGTHSLGVYGWQPWHLHVLIENPGCLKVLESSGAYLGMQRRHSLISVGGWVDPRAKVRPEGLNQWKIPMTPLETKPAAFRLVAQFVNLVRYRVPQLSLLAESFFFFANPLPDTIIKIKHFPEKRLQKQHFLTTTCLRHVLNCDITFNSHPRSIRQWKWWFTQRWKAKAGLFKKEVTRVL
jgi:hypothetical protein